MIETNYFVNMMQLHVLPETNCWMPKQIFKVYWYLLMVFWF